MFIDEVKKKVGSDFDRLARLSIVEEDSTKVSFVMDGILELTLSILMKRYRKKIEKRRRREKNTSIYY